MVSPVCLSSSNGRDDQDCIPIRKGGFQSLELIDIFFFQKEVHKGPELAVITKKMFFQLGMAFNNGFEQISATVSPGKVMVLSPEA